jgi:hypothetical protein
MAAHAKLSPSGAHRWMACPGSVVLEAEYPDDSSAYAAEGTCAHDLAASVLTDPEFVIPVGETKTVDGYQIKVTQDMADHVMDYFMLVWERAEGKTLLVEQRVPIGHLTGEEGATGTSDVIIIDYDQETIEVIDLKYGAGVKVYAEDNQQMQMYALGALHEHSIISDFSWATMMIHQPRMNHVAEWHVSTAELEAFADEVRAASKVVEAAQAFHGDIPDEDWAAAYLTPGEKQCRFCKAKATCPALQEEVMAIAGPATAHDFAEFIPDVPNAETGDNYLSMAMAKVDLVEAWCKAVRGEVERRLLAGETVDGWKLVEGRKGNRAWADEAAAEEMFKRSFRLRDDEMYTKKLISPTAAEKLLKDTPKRLKRAMDLMTRSEGKPSVAPAADRRPALAVSNLADEFRTTLEN